MIKHTNIIKTRNRTSEIILLLDDPNIKIVVVEGPTDEKVYSKFLGPNVKCKKVKSYKNRSENSKKEVIDFVNFLYFFIC